LDEKLSEIQVKKNSDKMGSNRTGNTEAKRLSAMTLAVMERKCQRN
jgi:hypothetical protein